MADDDGWTVVEKKKRVKGKETNTVTDVDDKPQNSEFADWTPVILSGRGKGKKKGTGPKVLVTKNIQSNKQTSTKNAASIERKFDDDSFKLEKVSHNLQMSIQTARTAKNWTQQQLATECSLPISVIKSYENGTAVPDSKHLEIMSKKLGTVLKKR
jgi:ribosome-binding protein aMBF1 (putative translation factor)